MPMTTRRIAGIFAGIGVCGLLLAAAGQYLLRWPSEPVGTWVGIGGAYLVCALVVMLMPRWWREHCDETYAQPATRRYLRAMWPLMIAYALLIYLAFWLLKRGIEPAALRALVALLPMVPLVLLMRAALRYLRGVDELQRRIETEAIGIASLIVSLSYFAGGLLHAAKVLRVDAGAAMFWVFPLLCGVYGIAKMVLTRRYL